MKIRITGKSLPKAQGGIEVKTKYGDKLNYNGVYLTPGSSFKDPESGKTFTYDDVYKKYQGIDEEFNARFGSKPPASQSVAQQPVAQITAPIATPSVIDNGFDLFAGPANQFTASGNQSNPYTWQTTTSTYQPQQQQPIQGQSAFKPVNLSSGNKSMFDLSKYSNPATPNLNPDGTVAQVGDAFHNASFNNYIAEQDRNKRLKAFDKPTTQELTGAPKYKAKEESKNTLSKIGNLAGKIGQGIQQGIAAASMVTNFIDNKNRQRDFNAYMRNQQMSDNLYPVQQGTRGDYVQTGSGYGAFRPDQMTVNKGMFMEVGGEASMPMPELVMDSFNRSDFSGYVPSYVTDGDALANSPVSVAPIRSQASVDVGPAVVGRPTTDTLTYLSHQQGVAGINAILKAAREGKEQVGKVGRESIDSNMRNNVYKDFWNSYGKLTPKNFLSYWEDKFSRKQAEASKKATPYDSYFNEAAQQTGTSPLLLKTIANIESSFNAEANRDKSTRYKGLMQLDIKQFGKDVVFNPAQSIYKTAEKLSKNNQQIRFEEGGQTNMSDMNKIRIKITGMVPDEMAYGGQTKGGTSLDLNSRRFYDDEPADMYDSVSRNVEEVDREDANIEAEQGETILIPQNDGTLSHKNIGGKRHSQGGTPLNVPQGSFVFSDTKKMTIKDPAILARFNKTSKSGLTPAEIAKQYDLDKYRAIVENPNTDPIAKRTAAAMLEKYERKLSELALVQEELKGFPQGTPSFIEGGLDQAKYGGALRKYQATGEVSEAYRKRTPQLNDYRGEAMNPFSNVTRYYGRQGYAGPKDDVGAWQKWMIEKSNTDSDFGRKFVDYLRSVPLTNKGKKMYGNKTVDQLSDAELMTQFNDNLYDFRAPRILPKAEAILSERSLKWKPTERTINYNEIPGTIPGTIPDRIPNRTEIIPGKYTPTGNDEKAEWTTPDKMNLLNSMIDYGTIKKYLPYSAQYAPVLPEVTFKDPSRELAANAEQANIQAQALANFAGPQSFMSNASAIQGKAAENVANIMARYQGDNVNIANQAAGVRSDILNKAGLFNVERANNLYDRNVMANQDYTNQERLGRKGMLTAWQQGYTNAADLYNTNISESPFYTIDPKTGMVKFKSKAAKAAFDTMKRTGSTGSNSMAAQATQLYESLYKGLDSVPADKRADAAVALTRQLLSSSGNSRNFGTSVTYPNDPRKNRTTTRAGMNGMIPSMPAMGMNGMTDEELDLLSQYYGGM